MGFPYTEVSPVLRSLQSSPVSVPLYNNLWLTSLSPCVCVCVFFFFLCVCVYQLVAIGAALKGACTLFSEAHSRPDSSIKSR